ncbi:PREDICTED: uncharacterized protein LOC109584379 isoform X1 [Amphimedon queenslandica]|uniref:Structure-specific endonuclease subunit SLX4 n=1 Tax=Amphimedon queenslandica TaxID=400682 RepID=A0A1X7U8T2_AMPQE|nr:PREDICTED: uncharacterized protein LOC109584379 isoform X1 [Amphimedon queenslandica]|eukprot:XP_019855666.1 PREDICTED: uncharacterized protein LOC109584379 isoform X1 [Amphimedon queenslandica]
MDSRHGPKKHKLSLKRRNPSKLKKEQEPQETVAQPKIDSDYEVWSKGQWDSEGDTVNIKKIKMEHIVDDDGDDFKIPTINIKKLKKTKGKENDEALKVIESEQLQLAMALSSSEISPPIGQSYNIKSKSRHKKGELRSPPTLLTSSIQNEVIATRLEELFTCQSPAAAVGSKDKDDVPLADQLSLQCPTDGQSHGSSEFSGYKTLWVLSASGPEEPPSVFNVPGLKDFIDGSEVNESKCCICHSDPCLATLALNSPVPNSLVPNSPVPNSPVPISPVPNSLVPNSPIPNSPVPNSIGMKTEVDVPLMRIDDDLSPTKRLKTDLNNLLTSSVYSDVVIKVSNGRRINGHSSILSVRSPAMARVLSSLSPDNLSIDCSSFSFESVNIFMRFMYAAAIPGGEVSAEIKQELITLSELWEVPDLLKILITTPTSSSLTTPTISPEHIPAMPSPLEGEMGCSSSVPTSSDEECTCMSHDIPIKAQSVIDTPSGCGYGAMLITPAGERRSVLQSDDNITPMPDYRAMATPHLKSACSKFGVRALPKKKMIQLLEQIYTYNHPLVDEEGYIVDESKSTGNKSEIDRKCVRDAIVSDTEMYQDILKYKPLELSFIHSKLKNKQINISREKLMDILDQMCVTFTLPRQRTKMNH